MRLCLDTIEPSDSVHPICLDEVRIERDAEAGCVGQRIVSIGNHAAPNDHAVEDRVTVGMVGST